MDGWQQQLWDPVFTLQNTQYNVLLCINTCYTRFIHTCIIGILAETPCILEAVAPHTLSPMLGAHDPLHRGLAGQERRPRQALQGATRTTSRLKNMNPPPGLAGSERARFLGTQGQKPPDLPVHQEMYYWPIYI